MRACMYVFQSRDLFLIRGKICFRPIPYIAFRRPVLVMVKRNGTLLLYSAR